jgi:hypothetical protein
LELAPTRRFGEAASNVIPTLQCLFEGDGGVYGGAKKMQH